MKLGIVMTNMRNGWVASNTAPHWTPTWDLMRDTALKAEEYGFDALLAAVKMRGWAGPTRHWQETLDSMSIMTALAAVTSRIKLYGSVSTLAWSPVVAAKQAVTCNDIADGRFGLNIVTGGEKTEYAQMGLWPGDEYLTKRYDYAREFTEIIKELWQTGRSNFRGEHFVLDDCQMGPLPTKPIDIVCAGQSDAGTKFCAEVGDHQFAIGKPTVEALTQLSERLQHAAKDIGGRSIGLYPVFNLVLRDTDEEAERVVEDWRKNQDYEAVADMKGLALTAMPPEGQETTKSTFLREDTFMFGIPRIVGGPETVAAKLNQLGTVPALSGILLNFQDFRADIDRFGRAVMPKIN